MINVVQKPALPNVRSSSPERSRCVHEYRIGNDHLGFCFEPSRTKQLLEAIQILCACERSTNDEDAP